MALLRRNEVDLTVEKQIITNMITNSDFLKEIVPLVKSDYWQTPLARKVSKWILNHYNQYEAAPKEEITDIFAAESLSLNSDEADLIEIFLQNLSAQYEQNFNKPFAIDKAIAYFRKRSLEVHKERLDGLIKLDKIDEAEKEVAGFNKVAKVMGTYVNPNDPEFIKKVMNEAEDDKLIRFRGALGDLLDWFCRGMLVSVQGGYGIGKSWILSECRMLGIFAGLNVFEFNFEMNDKRLAQRYYKRITAQMEQGGKFIYPSFDCILNQHNLCNKHFRTNEIGLYDPETGTKPHSIEYQPKGYKPCTFCRNHESFKRDYKMDSWFIEIERPAISTEKILSKTQAVTRTYGDNWRLKCFPRFSATLSDMERQLDIAEYLEGFIPDIIIVDYADIVVPELKDGNDEQKIDDIWKSLARIAGERHTLVITATQIKTAALNKRKSKMGDASGSARAKYGHPDIAFGIHQTPEEKQMRYIRVSKIKGRDEQFNELEEVRVLRQLEVGQAFLDSEREEKW